MILSPPTFFVTFYMNPYCYYVRAGFVAVVNNIMWFGLLLIASWTRHVQRAKYGFFYLHCTYFPNTSSWFFPLVLIRFSASPA